MKKIDTVLIDHPERFTGEKLMTKEVLEKALHDALFQIDKLMDDMGMDFPSHNSIDNIYLPVKNDRGWNTGFWSGILWLAYEATGDEKYKNKAMSLVDSFYERIKNKVGVDHHDMGFVFMPSCVAAYKLTGDEKAKEAAIMAADNLMSRYHEKAGYIQAWGKMGEQLRLIVDCMNNIPLLFWASEVTGDPKYYEVAKRHAETTVQYAIRDDGSTFHTYYFNEDGTPSHGATAQGASDDSTWARGQAWVISGLPLSYKYLKDDTMVPIFEAVTNFFLNRLPKDYIPYWDMIFQDGDGQYKDSSAAAIAACGMLQMIPQLPKDGELAKFYATAVDKMMYSLCTDYNAKHDPRSNGLILHAVYGYPQHSGVGECNIWGCYYYMEALVRLLKGTEAYW